SRLARCQLGIVVSVGLTIPLWDRLPLVFQLTGGVLPSFYLREALRLLVSLLMLAVPAVLMGVSFPLLIESLGGGPEQVGRRAGSVYALIALGAIAGWVRVGFAVLPALGSGLTLVAPAALSLVNGLLVLRVSAPAARGTQWRWAIAAPAALL